MEIHTMLSSAFTVVSLLAFIGIVQWAWSSRRHDSFANAANAPFAVPEESAAARNDEGETRR